MVIRTTSRADRPVWIGAEDSCHAGRMCRSIKTLRPPHVVEATQDDVRAAALQYVRKISGFRAPAAHNAATFATAVDAVEAATRALLDDLVVRGAGPPVRVAGVAADG